MSRFRLVFEELRRLQLRLILNINRLWSIRLSLVEAYQRGVSEAEFVPRRLAVRQKEEQARFERLLCDLNRVLSNHLDSALITFHSEEDVRTAMRIRSTIRYLQNALGGELPLRYALGSWSDRLNRSLPARSMN